MSTNDRKIPHLLMILDGWGLAPKGAYNAVTLAKTPNLDALFASCPHSRLACSGEAVGLPQGQMGNSEVGHTNIGAGRVVYRRWSTAFSTGGTPRPRAGNAISRSWKNSWQPWAGAWASSPGGSMPWTGTSAGSA